MKPKTEEPLMVVVLGWYKVALPRSKAYEFHTLLSEAYKVEQEKYIPETSKYLQLIRPVTDVQEVSVATMQGQYTDMTGCTQDEYTKYQDDMVMRAALMGKAFTQLTYQEWKEVQDDNA